MYSDGLHSFSDPDCDSHNSNCLDFFLFSDDSICSPLAFPLLGNSGHIVVSVSLTFSQTQNGMPCIIA